MIYLLLDIYYFKQIKKINKQLEAGILNEFNNIVSCKVINKSGNSIIIIIGNEKSIYPSQLIDIISKIYDFINNINKDLYGYNILIQILNEDNASQVKKIMTANLINLEEDESIWLDNELNDILSHYIDSQFLFSFWKILKIKAIIKKSESDLSSKWIRSELTDKLLFHIGNRLNYGRSKPGLLLVGENNTSIKDALFSSVLQIINKDNFDCVPKLFTLFNRQSPVHPFLNSINYNFFKMVPDYLQSFELKIWNNKSDIINYILENTIQKKCYDNFIKDFYILYNLYVSAYIRMMKKQNLPAFFIVEDLETYHIESINTLRILFNDFLNNSDFIPVLISKNDQTIKYFVRYNFKVINIRNISWKEVKSLASFLLPGIILTRSLCRRIIKNTGGNLVHIKHYLHILEKQGKIVHENYSYKYLNLKEKKIKFKSDNKVITILIINSFTLEQKEILYIICLLSGILNLRSFYFFLNFLGYSEIVINEALNIFSAHDLINVSSTIIPNFNFLKKTLENNLEKDNTIIREKVFNYIVKEWKENRFSQAILLFYFFIRNEYYEFACNLLPPILNRKFNEMDIHSMLPFLDSINKSIINLKDNKLKNIFELIILSSKLRLFIYRGEFDKAFELVQIIEKRINIYSHGREKGILLLRISSYHYYKGNIRQSINILKKSLLEIQDYGSLEDTAHIYLNMGCYFLGDGKIKESLEYLNLSDKQLDGESFEKLRCLTLKCVVNFILNKLSNIPDVLDKCLEIAYSIGKREWEVYIYFIMGRLAFKLGEYKQASSYFQKGINIIILYSFSNAYNIFIRWLCRSEIYSGHIYKSINILKNLDTKNETLFFLAEGYHFLGSNDKALSILNNAFKNRSVISAVLNEKISWNNGFSCFEGLCLKLEEQIPIIDIFIIYFRAYILSLEDNLDESLKELQRISKLITPAIDLYKHEYYLFYYLSLPKYRLNEGDSVNRLTLLNKSIAVLHEISNRITSSGQRSKFLNKNYWNNILYKAAKNNNLL